MSRSRKKNGVITDRIFSRPEYNRRFRRVNKHRVKNGKEPFLMYELINPWDVIDWKFWWFDADEESQPYYFRK